MNNIEKISKNIENLRKKNNLTLEELAFNTDLSYNSVWNMENGTDFKISSLIKLCNFYKLDITKIFFVENIETNEMNTQNIKKSLTEEQYSKLKNFLNILK